MRLERSRKRRRSKVEEGEEDLRWEWEGIGLLGGLSLPHRSIRPLRKNFNYSLINRLFLARTCRISYIFCSVCSLPSASPFLTPACCSPFEVQLGCVWLSGPPPASSLFHSANRQIPHY
ncbi:hypothetical protein BJX70DRAFT_302217 [Aspergillus crustosus]